MMFGSKGGRGYYYGAFSMTILFDYEGRLIYIHIIPAAKITKKKGLGEPTTILEGEGKGT
jgi:hypothetical protein